MTGDGISRTRNEERPPEPVHVNRGGVGGAFPKSGIRQRAERKRGPLEQGLSNEPVVHALTGGDIVETFGAVVLIVNDHPLFLKGLSPILEAILVEGSDRQALLQPGPDAKHRQLVGVVVVKRDTPPRNEIVVANPVR